VSETNQFRVTKIAYHAIDRFRARTGTKQGDGQVIERIFRMVDQGEEVELKPQYRVAALPDHRCQPARYVRKSGMIFVVEGDTVKTVHQGEAGRWRSMERHYCPKCQSRGKEMKADRARLMCPNCWETWGKR